MSSPLLSRTFPDQRVADHIDPTRKERRNAERRTGEFDRRDGERRFSTMDDKLAAQAKKQEERQYAQEPAEPSAFMDSLR